MVAMEIKCLDFEMKSLQNINRNVDYGCHYHFIVILAVCLCCSCHLNHSATFTKNCNCIVVTNNCFLTKMQSHLTCFYLICFISDQLFTHMLC